MSETRKNKRNSKLLLKLIPFLIAIATAVATLTPNKIDDTVVMILNQAAEILDANVLNSSPHAIKNGVVDLNE